MTNCFGEKSSTGLKKSGVCESWSGTETRELNWTQNNDFDSHKQYWLQIQGYLKNFHVFGLTDSKALILQNTECWLSAQVLSFQAVS